MKYQDPDEGFFLFLSIWAPGPLAPLVLVLLARSVGFLIEERLGENSLMVRPFVVCEKLIVVIRARNKPAAISKMKALLSELQTFEYALLASFDPDELFWRPMHIGDLYKQLFADSGLPERILVQLQDWRSRFDGREIFDSFDAAVQATINRRPPPAAPDAP